MADDFTAPDEDDSPEPGKPTGAAGAPARESSPATQTAGSHGLSRRGFLTGMLGGAAALAAAACGGSEPTPTPTGTSSPLAPPTLRPPYSPLPPPAGYRQYLPFVTHSGIPAQPGLEPMLQPTPSKTPEPTKTPTPEPPTPTPTPEATPFPPGPPSKLGIFIGHNDPQLFSMLKTQGVAVVKTLELDANFAADIKRTAPDVKLIGRIYWDQINLATVDPIVAAQEFVAALLPYADDPARKPYFDGWESVNEPVAANADEMARLAIFESERTRLLGERGIRSVIGNFGTGQPPMELWPAFLPAIQTALQFDGWLGLHEYSAPTMYYLSTAENRGRYPGVTGEDSGWLTLRYRKVYNEILLPAGLRIPLAMTELGIDGLVQPRPGPPDGKGWMDFQGYWAENGYGLWGPGAYVEQLVWYDDAMRQDDYVIGGTIFVLSGTAGWESYEIRGPVAMVLEQYFTVHASAPQQAWWRQLLGV